MWRSHRQQDSSLHLAASICSKTEIPCTWQRHTSRYNNKWKNQTTPWVFPHLHDLQILPWLKSNKIYRAEMPDIQDNEGTHQNPLQLGQIQAHQFHTVPQTSNSCLTPNKILPQKSENWNLRSTMSFKTPRKLRQKRGSGQIFEESAHKIDENLWPSLQLMVFPSKTNKIWGKELQLLVGKGDISLHRLNQHFINVHWMVHGVLHFPLTTHHTTTSTNRPPVLVRLRITSLHLVQSIFSATCPHNLIHCQSLAETKTQERHFSNFVCWKEKKRCFCCCILTLSKMYGGIFL